ncbi:MAG: HsmA family protein, partial [Candidatus Hermodarchaeota archaeon]
DTTGTTIMALNLDTGGTVLGPLDALFHSITGLAAIILMLIHAVWAIRVLLRQDVASAENFHKFSKYVWLFWLVPFFSPMVAQMI